MTLTTIDSRWLAALLRREIDDGMTPRGTKAEYLRHLVIAKRKSRPRGDS